MPIVLSKPFTRNNNVDAYDVSQMKKALNRLGYYQPLETTGITPIPDAAVFDALKTFQIDYHLPTTGIAKPDDDTLDALNDAIYKTPEGSYVWRTVEDGKVRINHANYNRTVRVWSDSPDPGEDFNCRCWAEPVKEIIIPDNASEAVKEAFKAVQDDLKGFDEKRHYLAARFLRHYLSKTGTAIELPVNAMDDVKTVQYAIEKNKKRFEDSIITNQTNDSLHIRDKILNLHDGKEIMLQDHWDVDLDKLEVAFVNQDYDFAWAIGSVKIRSTGIIHARRVSNTFMIDLKVVHRFNDVYDFEGGLDNPINEAGFKSYRLLSRTGYAKEFTTHWEKSQTLTGVLEIDVQGNVQQSDFKWKDMSR